MYFHKRSTCLLSVISRKLSFNARISPVGIDFRSSTIVENIDLIKSHLESRRSGKNSIETVDAIVDLEMSRRKLSRSLKDGILQKKRIGKEYFQATKACDVKKLKEIKEQGEAIRESVHDMGVALHDTEHKIFQLFNSLPNVSEILFLCYINLTSIAVII